MKCQEEPLGPELNQGFLTGPDLAHPLPGAQHRCAGMDLQSFMIKSEALEYSSHGDWTGAWVAVTDLDRHPAAVGKPDRVYRLSARFGHQTGNRVVEL
jgi:hypothetical protein